MIVVGIDPGPNESGVAVLDTDQRTVAGRHVPNGHVSVEILGTDVVVLEKFQSYGQGGALGASSVETIEWSGRFVESFQRTAPFRSLERLTRPRVKGHLLRTAAGGDREVRAALIARFGGPSCIKKGGCLEGFASHMWPALALAVVAAEKRGLVAWPEWRSGWRRA